MIMRLVRTPLAVMHGHSRRRFLALSAVTTLATGLGTAATAQENEDTPETYELGGHSDHWIGQSPGEIEDVENPTLAFEAGETYEVVWENLDGIEHNFVIVDGDVEEIVASDFEDEEGATVSLEFEASEEMAEYLCDPHPQTMRGEVVIDEPLEDQEAPEPAAYFEEGPTVGVEPVAEGLVAPTDFTDPPGTDYMLVTDQPGEIYAIRDDEREDEPWLDLTDHTVPVGEEFFGEYADPEGDYDERGLLGIEVHPDFEENCQFYVSYSAEPDEQTPEEWSHVRVVSEFTVEDGEPDVESEREILRIQQPQFNHNSGPMAFDPDGYLLVPSGDGGHGDDTGPGHVEDWYDENEGGNGQDTEQSLLGGVLRVDVDAEPTRHPAHGSSVHLAATDHLEEGPPEQVGEDGYAIPEDNPFTEGGDLAGEGLEEYYAWGLRNPFGITVSEEERVILGDPGQLLYEPVYEIHSGGNYGWNVREGSHCFDTDQPEGPPPEECPLETPEDVRGGEPLIDPVAEYPQVYEGQGVGIVVVGGHTYEAETIEDLEGKYLFGDWTMDQGRQVPAGRVFAATPEDVPEQSDERGEFGKRPREDLWDMEEVLFDGSEDGRYHHFVRMFGRDEDGEVYVLANTIGVPQGDTGVVHRLVPEGEGVEIDEQDEPPEDPEDEEEARPPDEEGVEE